MQARVPDVSTKDLVRVRRLAARRRAAVACLRCKVAKTRCTDYRPCKKCVKSILECVGTKDDSPDFAGFPSRDIMIPDEWNRIILLSRNNGSIPPSLREGQTYDDQQIDSDQTASTTWTGDGVDGPDGIPPLQLETSLSQEQNDTILFDHSTDQEASRIVPSATFLQDAGGLDPAKQGPVDRQQIYSLMPDPEQLLFLPTVRIQSSALYPNPLPFLPAMRTPPPASALLLPNFAEVLCSTPPPPAIATLDSKELSLVPPFLPPHSAPRLIPLPFLI